jgi:hypothetical protein
VQKEQLLELLGNLPRESGFKKRMRLHQAWWWTFVLGEESLGSTIQDGEETGKNFLTENARRAAEATIKERLDYGSALTGDGSGGIKRNSDPAAGASYPKSFFSIFYYLGSYSYC